MMTLDLAIDTVIQLPWEQQEMLIEIVQQRRIENRRQEIAREAREAREAFLQGKLKPQPFPEILAELQQCLERNWTRSDYLI